jgi:tetratricopeptide (TPR) repeat protein
MLLLALASLLPLTPTHAESKPVQNDADAKLALILKEGNKLANERKFAEAIARFDTVIAAYEDRYRNSKDEIRCARWNTESLYYLVESASRKKNMVVLASTWADAYFLKGYILVHIGQFVQARPFLEKAIKLSPGNAMYLSELGGVFQREKNWPAALQTFQSAEQATEFSPPDVKNAELGKAWRGIAYVYVEQGRLDEAEALYKKCLKLDPNDSMAAGELRYVEKQRGAH